MPFTELARNGSEMSTFSMINDDGNLKNKFSHCFEKCECCLTAKVIISFQEFLNEELHDF